jgi:hypothetical protein
VGLVFGLKMLEVWSHAPAKDVKAEVIELIHRLQELHHIVVLMYFLTSTIATELVTLAHFKTIDLMLPVKRSTSD